MYYSDDNYKNIPVPKELEKDYDVLIYKDGEFSVDEAKVKAEDKIKSYAKLDELQAKLIKNESYAYDDFYQNIKDGLIEEIKAIRLSLK